MKSVYQQPMAGMGEGSICADAASGNLKSPNILANKMKAEREMEDKKNARIGLRKIPLERTSVQSHRETDLPYYCRKCIDDAAARRNDPQHPTFSFRETRFETGNIRWIKYGLQTQARWILYVSGTFQMLQLAHTVTFTLDRYRSYDSYQLRYLPTRIQ